MTLKHGVLAVRVLSAGCANRDGYAGVEQSATAPLVGQRLAEVLPR